MTLGRWRLSALVAGMALGGLRLLASSSSSSLVLDIGSAVGGVGFIGGGVADARTASAVPTYLAAVNRLCDALLPKVTALTHGGSLDIPVADYLAQQPRACPAAG